MNDRIMFSFSPLIARDEDWPHINRTSTDGENKDDNNASRYNRRHIFDTGNTQINCFIFETNG